MSEYDYDLFVIGGGSGGVRAAASRQATAPRWRIAEEYRFGGTCVIRGCVPKKLLVYASRFPDEFEDARGLRLDHKDTALRLADADRQQGPRDRAAGRHLPPPRQGAASSCSTRARRWPMPNTVELARSGRKVTAKTILIATGGQPWMADSPAPSMPSPPTRLSTWRSCRPHPIVGGGYIAVEFAGIFAARRGDHAGLSRREGPARLRRGPARRPTDGRDVQARDRRAPAHIVRIEKNWSDYTVTLKDGSTLEVER